MSKRQGILERLALGPVIGDGGFVIGLEKRGYVRAGFYTPECVITHPEAVRQYHREFLRAGADVMQAYTFHASESLLRNVKNDNGQSFDLQIRDINLQACKIALEVAKEGNALVSASLTRTNAYIEGKGKDVVQAEYETQVKVFVEAGVDFIIIEYIGCIEAMEWAIETAKKAKLPIVATMCIGPVADYKGVPTGECAVRMVKAGADVVGINCNFGPSTCIKSMKIMKDALTKEGLNPYLICQPLVFETPECNEGAGYIHLQDAPFALEPRTITRFEAANFARACYEAGIHYIGGCCGFEPYHVRQMSEELVKERKGKVGKGTEEMGFVLDNIKFSMTTITSASDKIKSDVTAGRWKKHRPCTGRPHSAALAEIEPEVLQAFKDNYK